MSFDKIKTIYRNRLVQHILFWLVSYYVLLNLFTPSGKIEKIDIIYTALFLATIIPGIYINLSILIPRYLSPKRYFLYGILLVAVIATSAGFNLLFFDKWVSYLLPGYYFISYYEFFDIIKFVVVFIGITSLLKLSKGWFELSEAKHRLSQLQKEKAETELKALKGQINPHFLFNSLNSIYSLALSHSEKTPEIVLKLSDIMRYIIYEANVDRVILSKEIQYLKDYIELQKLRTDNRATITFEITGDPENVRIAPLLFFPLIENSFKHGIKGATSQSFVHIDLQMMEDHVTLIVENNKGITDDVEKKEYKGIGLANVKKRLEMIYPGAHQLKITDGEETFKVELTINHVK
ncbi:sensor histidine kinase [Prolixibacter sp. NT017]|uniref:sensor histidine kinase n=1 Tax=Prolixibacter sp. NT017 TaxID=2652390 RepID=UPI001273693E|nr:histidine kinase [Prolixibacter sp. NT017]GET24564.1 histidine kinase [Prolixibacter sp. NT017]